MRLLRMSSRIPYFVQQLAAWIDIDQPPGGLDLSSLDNCGYLPETWSSYSYRIVDQYRNAWWEDLGNGQARAMQRWNMDLRAAVGEFLAQVMSLIHKYSSNNCL
jgi:hypothetical protein